MNEIRLYTIGFTHKSAETFFNLLRDNGVRVLVDIRLKPDTQLSSFAKQRDLPYFLKHLANCVYRYMPEMAPTEEVLNQYRADKSWASYETKFNELIRGRNLIDTLDRAWWAANPACLLCSEHEPDHCHRRLVAEYMESYWHEIKIIHLL